MTTTLLLNASYEPLGGISMQRAVVLVLTGRAEVVEEGDRLIRSPTTVLAEPVVIRLVRYVKRVVAASRRPIPVSRTRVLERDRYTCQYCDDDADTIDHVVPRSRGGATSWTNLVAACSPCNAEKGNRLLSELGWSLPREPVAVRERTVVLRTTLPVATRAEWTPYLTAWA